MTSSSSAIPTAENPFRVEPANLPSSGGSEGMAMASNGKTLFPMLEKAVAGDDPQVRRIYSFDVRSQTFDERRFLYRLDTGPVSIGDFTQLGGGRFAVIERDNGQGTAAQIKRIYEVDLHHVNPDGTLVKKLAVDLMNDDD